jgi:hypothetical protein
MGGPPYFSYYSRFLDSKHFLEISSSKDIQIIVSSSKDIQIIVDNFFQV